MGSWSKDQPENILLPWIRKYGCTDVYVLFCLAALIFRHQQNFSPREFVFQDRLNTLDRRPGPRSFRHAGLRSWFPMRASFMLQVERPLKSRISRLIPTLSSRGFVFPDSTDTLDRRKGPESLRRAGLSGRFEPGAPLLLEAQWRGALISVDILASTSPFARGFVSIHENSCLIRCMGNLICSLKIKETDFVVSTPHSNCPYQF